MSAKIALQILGWVGSAGTVTTGLLFGVPKLKSDINSGVSDDESVKSFDEISDTATHSKSIVPAQKNSTSPPQ